MPRDCLEGVLRARWGKPAGRGQTGRNAHLVSADEQGDEPAGELEQEHASPGTKHGLAPRENLRLEHLEAGGVGFGAGPDYQVPGRLPGLYLPAPYFPQAAPQAITGHRGRLELGNDQSHPWLARCIFHPNHIEVLEAAAPAIGEAAANVGRAHEPVGPWQARRTRQDPPCFEGIETVSCFLPFFRRRERTARPQRVAMRARNPCLLIRRLLRGR